MADTTYASARIRVHTQVKVCKAIHGHDTFNTVDTYTLLALFARITLRVQHTAPIFRWRSTVSSHTGAASESTLLHTNQKTVVVVDALRPFRGCSGCGSQGGSCSRLKSLHRGGDQHGSGVVGRSFGRRYIFREGGSSCSGELSCSLLNSGEGRRRILRDGGDLCGSNRNLSSSAG